MIKVEAKVKGDGVDVSSHVEGRGEDIMAEALSIIESLMSGIKAESRELHAMMIALIAQNSSILLGEIPKEDRREMN